MEKENKPLSEKENSFYEDYCYHDCYLIDDVKKAVKEAYEELTKIADTPAGLGMVGIGMIFKDKFGFELQKETTKILCEFCGTTKQVRTLDGKSWAINHHPLCQILMNSTTTS